MADNSALLAAQAQAGQAGVDAYQQAQAEVERRKRAAVEQAMREAALRGAPEAGQQAAAIGISAPGDERLASLAQDKATYEADLARRAQRSNDYALSVDSARNLIPEQIRQAVAPIEAKGRAAVDEINAKSAADLALMQARAAAARRGGGGGGRGGGGGSGGQKVTAGQAQAMAANIAGQVLVPKAQAAQAAAQVAARMEPAAQPVRQMASMNAIGDAFAARSQQEYEAKQMAGLNQVAGTGTYGGISGVASYRSGPDTGGHLVASPGFTAQREVPFAPTVSKGRDVTATVSPQSQRDANIARSKASLAAVLAKSAPSYKAWQSFANQQVDVGGTKMPYYQLPSYWSATGTIGDADMGYGADYARDAAGLPIERNQADYNKITTDPGVWQQTLHLAFEQLRKAGYKIPEQMEADVGEPTLEGVGSFSDYLGKKVNAETPSEARASAAAGTSAEQRALADDFETKTGWNLTQLSTSSNLAPDSVYKIMTSSAWDRAVGEAMKSYQSDGADGLDEYLAKNNVDPKTRALIRVVVKG